MEGRPRDGLVVRETFLLVVSSVTSLQSTHPTAATWFFSKDANQTNPPCLKTSDSCLILSRGNLNTSTWPQGSSRSLITRGRPGLHAGGLPPTSESVMMLPEEGVWVGMRGRLAGGGLSRGCLSEHGCSSSGLRAGSPPPRPLGSCVEPPGPWRLCLHGHRSWLLVLLCTSYYLKLT